MSAPTRCWASQISFRISALSLSTRSSTSCRAQGALKELRAEVHVLTLSATPIPRTLQLAMTGCARSLDHCKPAGGPGGGGTLSRHLIRGLCAKHCCASAIAAAKSFYVCPRIDDIAEARAFLARTGAGGESRCGAWTNVSHALEEVMTAFYEGQYDILLSTASWSPASIFRQQYADRSSRRYVRARPALSVAAAASGGRKTRAYALFTLPATKPVTVAGGK